jgi:chromosomal replication initiator protein
MTLSPKVWGDALRRLQDEIPDFAFAAWIAPLTVKVADDRVFLGCESSFHRDRVRTHYADMILDCWRAARSHAGADRTEAGAIELLTMKEFNTASGLTIEALQPVRSETSIQTSMRRVAGVAAPALAATATAAVQHTPPMRPEANVTAAPTLQRVPDSKRRQSTWRRTSSPARCDTGLEPESGPTQAELPFSFESFIVGPCNALAREAALALARQRQRSLNQLYLGGESGMGKTHLARATAAEAQRHGRNVALNGRRDRPSKIVYTSAERFTSEFVSAMRLGHSEEWKRRYRGPIGMFIVEDVQFFSGRAKTQLELFHTVQHVLDAGGSVLLTGDRAPRDLGGLDERMRDQVGRGFVAELEMPDALVRRHILRSKAASGGVHLPPDCLDLLVESTAGSVRDIESVLIQVVTTSSLLGRPIDLVLTQEAISLKSGAGSSLAPKTIATSEIVRIVAAFFGKRPEALAGRSRRRDVLIPRQLAMYLAHRYTDASFTEIGRGLGRDHPSVRNAITRVERLVLENAPLRYQVEALSERIDQTLKRPTSIADDR